MVVILKKIIANYDNLSRFYKVDVNNALIKTIEVQGSIEDRWGWKDYSKVEKLINERPTTGSPTQILSTAA